MVGKTRLGSRSPCSSIPGANRRWLIPTFAALLASSAPMELKASAVDGSRVNYQTSALIGTSGVDGSPVVRYIGGSGVANASESFSLGSFAVNSAGSGAVTRYDQTPLTISYWIQAIDGKSTSGADGTPASPLVIHGWLSGVVGGSTPSSLSVLFDQGIQPDDPRFYQPLALPPFPSGSASAALRLDDGQTVLSLSTSGATLTSVDAQLDLTPNVPEPRTLLIFAASGLTFFLARRYKRV